jgi:hypothetical protein
VAGVACIAAALITFSDGSSDEESTGQTLPPGSPTVSITSVALVSSDRAGTAFRLAGESRGVDRDSGDEIIVAARRDADEEAASAGDSFGASDSSWIFLEAASELRLSETGSWRADVLVPPEASLPITFIATVWSGGCGPDEECANGPILVAESEEAVAP